jgi:hypothetical protein
MAGLLKIIVDRNELVPGPAHIGSYDKMESF